MDVAQRLRDAHAGLTAAERRVAEIVGAEPQLVAFGTVAAVAARADVGAASVMRLATKLGFDGFSGLQAAVRDEVASRLRPAVERIRRADGAADPLVRARTIEQHNVAATLGSVDHAVLDRAVKLLSDRRKRVVVVSGDASAGVALQFAGELGQLRSGVERLDGNPVAVARRVAFADRDDVVVALDLRRYDAWVLRTVAAMQGAGAALVSVSDHAASPLAAGAVAVFTAQADAVGPFDSHVGVLALLGVLVAGVADRLRDPAEQRLRRIESTWTELGALEDP